MKFYLNGWNNYSIWDHSSQILGLYEKRCRKQEEEMIAHKQAANILKSYLCPHDVFLDAGCGSGYFFHSLSKQNVTVDYFGIDASEALIEIGKRWMPQYNLSAERLIHGRIEDLDGEVDHVICINVLSNIDNYHRPLERLLKITNKTLMLRESLSSFTKYSYVKDKFLDPGVDLNVYVNTYNLEEIIKFIQSYGFETKVITDIYTNGQPQKVIGHDHYWTFILATKCK